MAGSDPSEVRLERGPSPSSGVVVLDLGGELDLAVSGRFHELVDEVAAERPGLVVADVTDVGFIDSTMLRELLRADRELQEAGGRLVVAGVQPAVLRLLELTGTAGVFELAQTREAALTSPG